MAKSTMYNIFNSLVKAAKTTDIEHIYLNNRPKTSDEKMKSFVIINLPSRFYRKVKGNTDFVVETTGLFDIGVKAKQDGTPNINAQTSMVQSFMDLFPINDDYIMASNPQILLKGDDETGFQRTAVMFDIRTKINQFKK